MDQMDIIIVNYHSTDYLKSCLASLEAVGAMHWTYPIWVVDNSGDTALETKLPQYPHLTITVNNKNLGFAGAVNQMIDQGKAPYILLLNPDTCLLPGFFDELASTFDAHPDGGIIGPRVLNSDGSVQGSARAFPTFVSGFFGRNSLISKYYPNNRFTRANILTGSLDEKRTTPVDWISGAGLALRRTAVEDVGALDERFFMYWEDVDLCRRMWNRGWQVLYCPRISMIHHGGCSSEKRIIRSVIDFHVSSFRYISKYMPLTFRFLFPFVISGLFVRMQIILCFHLFRKSRLRVRRRKG
ncbi:MAG: hypothetical protein CSA22_10570 [Deltaproteobacteria bacterium]|nr:MAG: hypothetical protein CSA22_10570 [Deltaproteobacteria bacterium]